MVHASISDTATAFTITNTRGAIEGDGMNDTYPCHEKSEIKNIFTILTPYIAARSEKQTPACGARGEKRCQSVIAACLLV